MGLSLHLRKVHALVPMEGTKVHGFRKGARIPLALREVVGAGARCTLQLAGGAPDHHRFMLWPDGEAWRATGRAMGLLKLNGEVVSGEVTLRPRDVLSLGTARLIFVEEEERSPRHPGLEAALADDPGDETRWLAWRDWLLETGHPEARFVTAGDHTPARLEALAGELATGSLRVTWRHGFAQALRVRVVSARSGVDPYDDFLERVAAVLALPSMRFLERLWLELTSVLWQASEKDPKAASAFLDGRLSRVWARSAGLPALRTLKLGVFWAEALPPEAKVFARVLRERSPRCAGPERVGLPRPHLVRLDGEGASQEVQLEAQQWPARAVWELGRTVEPQFDGFRLVGDHDGFHAVGPLAPEPTEPLAVTPGAPLREGQVVAKGARGRLLFRAGP